ncbi:hypothetical protein H2248_005468 [Termitomyces sp. 'cryptogamus']|nr:hypothetical protein H2248_005468 [Termitomyces sp. 'cryptogamus']
MHALTHVNTIPTRSFEPKTLDASFLSTEQITRTISTNAAQRNRSLRRRMRMAHAYIDHSSAQPTTTHDYDYDYDHDHEYNFLRLRSPDGIEQMCTVLGRCR